MSLLAFGLTHIVKKSGGKQAGTARNSIDGRFPSPGKQSVIELKSQTGDTLGMREVGIEAIRPELHATSGKGFNLFALGQRSAPRLPQRIAAEHFGAVAFDAPSACGKNSLAPKVARTYIRKNVTG